MQQVHLKLLLCLLLATLITGQDPTAAQTAQPLISGQSQMNMWGGFSAPGAFQQQPTATQFATGFGQAGMGSQFGGGLGQAGMGSQFGGGLGQAGMGSQFGGGFGQAAGAGFGQSTGAGFGQATGVPQTTGDIRNTGADITSGTTQQYGSSAAVPAASDSRSASSNTCHNIIDSVFPSFSHYCSVLPQTTFSLPNFFGHNSKRQANDLLRAFRPALESNCFEDIRMFVCPLFFPPCDSEAILPCASYCRAVKSRCGNFDLTDINCDQLPEKSEFCPSVGESTRLVGGLTGQERGSSYNDYSSQARFVNDYPSTSVLTRSSSSYGTGERSAPSSYGTVERSAPSSYGTVERSAPSSYGTAERSASSYGTVERSAPSSYGTVERSAPSSYGTVERSAPSSSYGTAERSASSYGTVERSAPSSYGTVERSAPSSYGTVERSAPSSSYGSDRTFSDSSFDSGIKSSGSAYGTSIKSVAPSSYGSDRNLIGSSFGNNIKAIPTTSFGGDRSLVDSSFSSSVKSGGSAYGSSIKSVAPSSYNNGGSYGGSSYGNDVKTAPSGSYGNKGNSYGGSSYGNDVKTASSGSYGNKGNSYGGSSYGNDVKTAPSGSYGNKGNSYGGSSYGNDAKTASSGSYGNKGNSYGGSSYGNGAKSATYGTTSYGNTNNYGSGSSYGNKGNSYGGSSYGNSGNYGSSYGAEPTGPPYGIQSTGEYTTYYPEKLDLSECGPTPTENPCTLSGPQYYPIPGYPKCYIQCSLERMFVKPCPNYLVWNTRINACDWPTVAEYPVGNNDYSSSSSNSNYNNYGSGSSYSYGRKKRSSVERKKRFFPGGLFSDPKTFEVPLGPPVPGLIPLPGFPGPIGIPGPLVPPPFFGPPFIPPFGPIPPPMIPPIVPPVAPIPPPIFPPFGPIVPPIAPIPPPILPPPLPPFLPPIVPPMPIPLGGPLLPPLPMSIPATFIPGPPPIFGAPFGPLDPLGPFGPFGGPLGPFGPPFGPGIGGPFGPGIGGPFGPGIGGPFGPGIGGPFGPGLGLPFGPFGGPFTPFGGPLEPFGGPFGPLAGPFGIEPFFDNPFDSDFGFGGGFPFGDEFYGGFPGPFFEPFPFPGGYDIYPEFGGKGGYKKDYDDDSYGKGYGKSYKNKGGYNKDSYDNGYNKGGYNKGGYNKGGYDKGGYDKSYSDKSYSKPNYKMNGGYQDKRHKGYGQSYSKNNYDSDSYGSYGSYGSSGSDYYRKKRNYDLNVDQDRSLLTQSQERSFPQQSRLFSMNSYQQQNRLPIAKISQPSLCAGKDIKSNIPHPTDATKYISCLNEEVYEIMECPMNLIFNAGTNKCEKVKNTELLCEGENPCLNGGQCHQTGPSTLKCTCRASWTGEYCETPVSSCASNPCGEGNECHTLLASDYKQDYVCVCNGRKSYGLTCDRNTVPNPCLNAIQDHEQYYPFAYSARAYLQCNGDLIYARPCAPGLYWNQEAKICDREETSPARPAEDQPSSYQVNYNNRDSKVTYNRPTVSMIDQSADKQQGYRYRNYNPHVMSNDQITNDKTFNQINTRKEIPKVHRFLSAPMMKQYHRRFQNQPISADQKTTTFVQPTQERSTFRPTQSASYRR